MGRDFVSVLADTLRIDWTCDREGRAKNSRLYHAIQDKVAKIVEQHFGPLGGSFELINQLLSKLVYDSGFAPTGRKHHELICRRSWSNVLYVIRSTYVVRLHFISGNTALDIEGRDLRRIVDDVVNSNDLVEMYTDEQRKSFSHDVFEMLRKEFGMARTSITLQGNQRRGSGTWGGMNFKYKAQTPQ